MRLVPQRAAQDIKAARRTALDALLAARRGPWRSSTGSLRPAREVPTALGQVTGLDDVPRLSVMCRLPEQVEALCTVPGIRSSESPVDEIVCDHLELKGIDRSVKRIHAAGKRAIVAAPRIIKPSEAGLWPALVRGGANGMLIRSAGLVEQLTRAGPGNLSLRGDFSLGVANAQSALLYLGMGLERLTPTHDCSGAQIEALARRLPAGQAARLEPILHTHVPIFHTEHCVYASKLSEGNSYLDCGHPCERHILHLRTAQGADNLVLADVGCRNTVFNAEAQSGATFLRRWLDVGIRRFRLELVDEPPHVAIGLVSAYMGLLTGSLTPDEVLARVSRAHDSNGNMGGVGEGSLRVATERAWSALRPTRAAAARAEGGKRGQL